MASALPSAEVAADFRESLQDLQMNNRYEISNLTIIAKENTEHAMAISRELENHIKTTPANRKLPPLYVLDSIVKNVGTPYTIYLGRNLYSTFMDSYALVDGQTRKNMESMLKTWKEPVPGSLETRPVFSVDITRPIENALIKARTAYVQHQQQQARTQRNFHALPPRPAVTAQSGWRSTPTPPQNDPRFAPPPSTNAHPYGTLPNYEHSQPQQFFKQPPASALSQQLYPGQGFQNPDSDWLNDLENLATTARAEFAANPYDGNIQQKLKALLDLQTILKTQQLAPAQKQMIRDQVAQLTLAARQSKTSAPRQAPSLPIPPPTPQQLPPSLATNIKPGYPPPPPPVSSTALAQLLGSADLTRHSTPPIPQPTPPPNMAAIANALGSSSSAVTQAASGNGNLIEALQAAGLLSASSASHQPSSSSNSHALAPPLPVSAAAVVTPPVLPVGLARPPLAQITNDVKLTSASIKTPRPHLVDSLYGAKSSQCSTCGRRFANDEQGRAKKARHLDFHFRTNQRIADASRVGINRCWYIDELEWIRFREVDDGDEAPELSAGMDGSHGLNGIRDAVSGGKDVKKLRYVRTPADPAAKNQPCPICQDKFETVWHDGAQDWVWMDAVDVGGRIFHASCRDEVTKDTGAAPMRTALEPILGKRKADGEDEGASRLKREMVV